MTNIKKIISLTLVLPLLLSSSACSNREGATLIGGATGALLGSQFGGGDGRVVGAALGAIGGALIGNKIGTYMDEQDKMKAQASTQHALENARSGTTSTWRNPDSGHYGSVTPRKAYSRNGKQCREYLQTVTIGGKTQQAYGKACRESDGSWQIAN